MRERLLWAMFALWYVLTATLLVQEALAKPVQPKTEPTVTEADKVDEEMLKAVKAFQASGLDIAEVMRQQQHLRSVIKNQEETLTSLRAQREMWDARNIQLTKENEDLREWRDEHEEQTYADEQAAEQDLPLTWMQYIFGTRVVTRTRTQYIKEEDGGCQDISCCLGLLWHAVWEALTQLWHLTMLLVRDPFAQGKPLLGWVVDPDFWSPVLGGTLAFGLVNMVLWMMIELEKFWKALKVAGRVIGRLPCIDVFRRLAIRRGQREGTESPALREVKAELQKIADQVKRVKGANKESQEIHDVRVDLENLKAVMGQMVEAPQQVAEQGTAVEQQPRIEKPSGRGNETAREDEWRRKMEDSMRKDRDMMKAQFQEMSKELQRAMQIMARTTQARAPTQATRMPAGPRMCQTCGKVHSGECWSLPCQQCGQKGPCVHRWRGATARPRSPPARQATAMAIESDACPETHMDMQQVHEMEANLRDEASQAESSISFRVADEPTPEQPAATSSEANLAEQHKKYVVKGRLIVDETPAQCDFLLDTGSDVSILSQQTCERFGIAVRSPREPQQVRGVGGGIHDVEGTVTVLTKFGSMQHEVEYLIVRGNNKNILGAPDLAKFQFNMSCGERRVLLPSGEQLFCHVIQKNG